MPTSITQAFTCIGPYAILIMLGIKRAENRCAFPQPCKGRCAVGCNKEFDATQYGEFVRWASRSLAPEEFDLLPAWADVKDWAGKIVGACDYSAMRMPDGPVGGGRLRWDEGYDCWWSLSEIVCFDQPIPCRGNVGMWKMPSELAAKVNAADELATCVGTKISSAADAGRLFRLAIPKDADIEGFLVLPLDEDRCVLSAPILVALGEETTTVVQPGEVFAAALKLDAKAIVVAHNHPSGDLTPSRQDQQLTEELRKLGKTLGIGVLDHLVL